LQWKDTLIKNGGNFSQLYSMSPPPDHVIEAFNKNAKRKHANQDADGKDKKKSKRSKACCNKAERKAALEEQGVPVKSSSESVVPYTPSALSSLASLNNATDYKHYPSNVHNLPVLCVVMFKDPPVVAPMSPTASSAQGPLAICVGRSANLLDTAIDK
jgi:hypothetical protein